MKVLNRLLRHNSSVISSNAGGGGPIPPFDPVIELLPQIGDIFLDGDLLDLETIEGVIELLPQLGNITLNGAPIEFETLDVLIELLPQQGNIQLTGNTLELFIDTRLAITGFTLNDYLIANAPIWPGQEPFLVSIWFWNGLTTNNQLYTLGQLGALTNRRLLWSDAAAGALFARSTSADNQGTTTSSTSSALPNQWNHIMASFISPTLREVWLNGANMGSTIVSRTPAAPTHTLLGIRSDIGAPNPGAMAGLTIWDGSFLSPTNRGDLANLLFQGADPEVLNAGSGVYQGKLHTNTPLDFTNPPTLAPFTMQGQLSAFPGYPPIALPGS